MNSALYRGVVRHVRHAPVRHAFSYRVWMLSLDLDELDEVFAGRWLWSVERPNLFSVRRRDALGDPAVPLAQAARNLVERATGSRPEGRIVHLAQPRCFGYAFNPVSFLYCHDRAGRLTHVLAEITNTPWGERRVHVLALDAGEPVGDAAEGRRRFRFAKDFHVSPFMGMDQVYDWTLGPPGARLSVAMASHEGGRRMLDATLELERRPLDGRQLARVALRHPFMTGKTIAAIHWQALRLWLKRVPFHVHPGTLAAERAALPGRKAR